MNIPVGKPFIEVTNLNKSYTVRDGEVKVLKDINVTINYGDFVIIFGPSGCGKSTLLHTLLGLEAPTGGNVMVEKKNYYAMTEDERAMYRRFSVGIIYQQPLWINSLNVMDNVAFTLHLMDIDENSMNQKVLDSLALVGMDKWAHYRPTELSSGQQQKISLARAMSLDPVLLVADEPTGNLDTVSGEELIDTFIKFNKLGKTIIMVTHDLEYLKYGSRIIHMIDGQVVEEHTTKHLNFDSVKGKRGGGGPITANVRDPDFLKKLGL